MTGKTAQSWASGTRGGHSIRPACSGVTRQVHVAASMLLDQGILNSAEFGMLAQRCTFATISGRHVQGNDHRPSPCRWVLKRAGSISALRLSDLSMATANGLRDSIALVLFGMLAKTLKTLVIDNCQKVFLAHV